RQSENAVETARNRLRQARTAAGLTHSRVNDAIEQARIAVRSAEAQLADVRAGARSQELNQAQARVDQARSALKLAKLSLDRMSSLAKNGAVAQAQVDSAQMEYDTAQGGLRVAEQALDLAKEGARTEQVRLAELGVSQAKQTLAQTLAQSGQADVADRDVRTAEVAVDQAEESVRLARAQLAQVASVEQDVLAARAVVRQAGAAHGYSQTQVNKHTVYAPISGVVAARNTEPGQSASPGIPLMRIVELDPLRVSCEASELQVAHLRVGQEAQVTVDALVGREFAGRITDIAPQVRSGQRIYTVRAEIANSGRLLRAGMFARARIVTGSRQSVVLVPRDTLIERGEKRVVYAVVDKVVKVRDVRIGAAQASKVEITSGVRAGDLLVLGGQSLLADGQQVDPQQRDAPTATAAPGGASE
ncbi:MAG: efflux RND transporter periplasmic adaptor subunit, partial [Armatimonadota bacterium]